VATVVKPSPSSEAQKLLELSQAICGASIQNVNPIPGNGSCGLSNIPRNGSCGARVSPPPGLGTVGNACGGSAAPRNTGTSTSPRAEVVVTLTGGATGDDRVVAGLRARFRACANQALTQDPSMQGKLTIMVAIAGNGEVTTANVASNSGLSETASQCMARGVRNAQFPATTNPRTVTLQITQTKQSP
jgi:hypothetical protein